MFDTDRQGNPLDIYESRLKKVSALKELGLDAWPELKHNTIDTLTLHNCIENGSANEAELVALSGRLMIKRDHGKSFFGKITDASGSIQIYVKHDVVGDELFDLFVKLIDVGDFVWIRGYPFVTKTGEPTLKVVELALVSKCLRLLPEKFHGLTDVETRYRQRYLDLIANPESKDRFRLRSKITTLIRLFLLEHSFMEVETPMLHSIAGGAAAKPFVTHHNTYDLDLYLRIAPELYLKRLVIGGFDRVFEINRNFRNEGVSTKHNPEFTMLEFYMAYGDYKDGISLLCDMLKKVALSINSTGVFEFNEHKLDFNEPFHVLDMQESLIKVGLLTREDVSEDRIDNTMLREKVTIHAEASYGEKIYALFDALVEHKLISPTFITGFPVEVSPLAKKDSKDASRAARFELFVCGMELANGYTELNDPLDQAERFKQQMMQKLGGNVEAHEYDQDYILALEYGLPPTVGVGVGIDRLVMLLTNTQSIKDVILFPTLRPKVL